MWKHIRTAKLRIVLRIAKIRIAPYETHKVCDSVNWPYEKGLWGSRGQSGWDCLLGVEEVAQW